MKIIKAMFTWCLILFISGCSSTSIIKAYRSSTYMDRPCVYGEVKLGWADRWQALWTGRMRVMQRQISIPYNYNESSMTYYTNSTQPFGFVFGNKLTWDEGRYGWADIDLGHWADSMETNNPKSK